MPFLLRLHVLVMEFIGKAGWAAPRLKDASLSEDKLRESYVEMIMTMRRLYQKCKLVHGDLSEYNILYFEGHLYIIDVSQSVHLDHPRALDFLREDCLHVSDFFKKHGVAVMSVRELFDFIVDASIADDLVDNYLEKIQQNIFHRGHELSAEDEIAESVFVQSFIPRTLDDVKNYEKDIVRIMSGENTEGIYYQTVTGLHQTLPSNPEQEEVPDHIESQYHEIEAESGSGEEEEDDDDEQVFSDQTKTAAADPKAVGKENKKKVKEEKREARKNKIPKAVKKRKEKIAKSKHR